MRTRFRPSNVVELDGSDAIFFSQHKAHARFYPIFHRVGQYQFEFTAWHTASHTCAPVIFWAKVELPGCPHLGLPGRTERPPGVETCGGGYCLKDLLS